MWVNSESEELKINSVSGVSIGRVSYNRGPMIRWRQGNGLGKDTRQGLVRSFGLASCLKIVQNVRTALCSAAKLNLNLPNPWFRVP
jgi:hypothetical protein